MVQPDSTLWWTFPDITEQRLQSRLGVKVKDKLEVNVTDRLTAVSRSTQPAALQQTSHKALIKHQRLTQPRASVAPVVKLINSCKAEDAFLRNVAPLTKATHSLSNHRRFTTKRPCF